MAALQVLPACQLPPAGAQGEHPDSAHGRQGKGFPPSLRRLL